MRYLPHTPEERTEMLNVIGAESVNALFKDIPEAARLDGVKGFNLPNRMSEMQVEREFHRLSRASLSAGEAKAFFLGAGAYRHHVPATVDYVIQRGEFLTSYTPYQPEVTQGTLQYLFEFQTQVAQLTGMEVANASMYDGSTAMSEAIFMARRLARRTKALLAGGVHGHYRRVAATMTDFTDDEIVRLPNLPADPAADRQQLIDAIDEKTSCVVMQTPDVFGHIHDLSAVAEAAHAKGALLIVVVTEILSLGALKSPGEMGADIVVAEGQSIGNGLNFGGPYLGLFATRQKFVRQLPGRICGETADADGRRGFVLTLSTREQHIRREKATSNICTNSGLCALAFTTHLTLLGEAGLRQLALANHARAQALKKALDALPGCTVLNDVFFNEMTLKLPVNAIDLVEKLAADDVLAGVPARRLYPHIEGLDDLLILAATELTTDDEITVLADAIREAL